MDSPKEVLNYSLVEEFVRGYFDEDFSSVMSIIDLGILDYTPFNVEALHKQIKEIAKANRMNNHQIVAEMTAIIRIALSTGNLQQYQIDKMSNQILRNKINTLIKKWGICIKKNTRDTTSLKSNSLTFTRVLCVFPQIASGLLIRNPEKFKHKLPDDAAKYVAKTYKLPMAMKHMGFGGLIPKDVSNSVYNKILEVAYLAFLAEFSFAINPNLTKTFAKAYADQQGQKTAAINGPISHTDRIICLMSMGLDTVEAVSNMVDVANLAMATCGYQTRYSMDTFQTLIQGEKVKIVEDDGVYAQLVAKAPKIAAISVHRCDNSSGASSSSQQISETTSGDNNNDHL